MHEIAVRGGGILAGLEDADAVSRRAVAQMLDHQPGLEFFRKGDRGVVLAARFDHEPDHRRVVNIQTAHLDQIAVGDGVEIGVIGHVVHVAIDIVIHPAGRHVAEPEVVVADRAISGHGVRSPGGQKEAGLGLLPLHSAPRCTPKPRQARRRAPALVIPRPRPATPNDGVFGPQPFGSRAIFSQCGVAARSCNAVTRRSLRLVLRKNGSRRGVV